MDQNVKKVKMSETDKELKEDKQGKKLVNTKFENENIFENSGKTEDEVVMVFADKKKLYVSKNMLIYASPVFEAMFQHNFKERLTETVQMTDKSYDDVKEFLLCLHPGVQKPIDDKNMLRVFPLANEYQVESIMRKCKNEMTRVLLWKVKSAYQSSGTKPTNAGGPFGTPVVPLHLLSDRKTNEYKNAEICLSVLAVAVKNNCDDIIDQAVLAVSCFGYKVFSGFIDPRNRLKFKQSKESTTFSIQFYDESNATCTKIPDSAVNMQCETLPAEHEDPTTKGLREKCKLLYDGLSDSVKVKLLERRLERNDSGVVNLKD